MPTLKTTLISFILLFLSILSATFFVSCNDKNKGTETKESHSNPSGIWKSKDHVIVIGKDGTFDSITYTNNEESVSISKERWEKTNLKVFEFDFDIPHQTRVRVWREKMPDKSNAVEVNARVYRIRNHKDQTKDFVYFSHCLETNTLKIDHGCYSNAYSLVK